MVNRQGNPLPTKTFGRHGILIFAITFAAILSVVGYAIAIGSGDYTLHGHDVGELDSNVQRDITGDCAGQVIVGINDDGTLTCQPDDRMACTSYGTTSIEFPEASSCCGGTCRYFPNSDTASVTQRCKEINAAYDFGYATDTFDNAGWCVYCNAQTRRWARGAWRNTGCVDFSARAVMCCDYS